MHTRPSLSIYIFHFLRTARGREIARVAFVHAESGRPNVSLREYFTEIMATGINIALFVITEMEQRKVAGLDVG